MSAAVAPVQALEVPHAAVSAAGPAAPTWRVRSDRLRPQRRGDVSGVDECGRELARLAGRENRDVRIQAHGPVNVAFRVLVAGHPYAGIADRRFRPGHKA